jgi:hypothetical protein
MLGAYYPGQSYPGRSGSIGATGTLIVQDQSISVTIGSPTLSQKYNLVVNDMGIATAFPNTPIGVHLGVQDVSVAISIGSVTLQQKHSLVVDSSTVATIIDNILLSQKGTLDINDVSVATDITSPVLITTRHLLVDGTYVDVTIDNVAIQQKSTLDISNMQVTISMNGEIVKFKPPIDPLAGLQTVIFDIPFTDKPLLRLGIDIDKDRLNGVIVDSQSQPPGIGSERLDPAIDRQFIMAKVQLGEEPQVILNQSVFAIEAPNSPFNGFSREAETALMDDTTALMEDSSTLMGGRQARGDRPVIDVQTIDRDVFAVDNDTGKPKELNNVSR